MAHKFCFRFSFERSYSTTLLCAGERKFTQFHIEIRIKRLLLSFSFCYGIVKVTAVTKGIVKEQISVIKDTLLIVTGKELTK